MSKEREAYTQSEVEQAVIHGYNAGYKSATDRYQPLLAAKEEEIAEIKKRIETPIYEVDDNGTIKLAKCGQCNLEEQITTLKALLEQAREGLEIAEGCINAHSERLGVALNEEGNSEPQFACEATYACDKIAETLAAINAATGEK